MGFFQNFPYSNHHNMNMDWILDKMREAVDTATAANTTADETVEYVNEYFAKLELTEEASLILNRMYNSGKLSELIAVYIDPLVSEQDKKIASYYALTIAHAEAIAELSARMDTFTELPEGSTAGDAELADIRVAYDGVNHPSAGDAVRGQCLGLSDRFNTVYQPLPISWTDGAYFRPSDGSSPQNAALSKSLPIDVTEYRGLDIEIKSRVFATQGFGFRTALGNVIVYRDGNSEGIEAGYPTIKITVPENAVTLVITSLTTDKAKCFVRPAISALSLHKYSQTLFETTYPKLELVWNKGFYINGSGGMTANEQLSASDYVNISKFAGMPLEFACRLGATWGFSFYDISRTQISSITTADFSGDYGVVDIPANAHFARITAVKDLEADFYLRPVPSVEQLVGAEGGSAARLYPLNIAMFGDSIMLGRDGDGPHTSRTPYTIPNTVATMLGCNAVNYGVGSMGYVALGDGKNAYDKIASTDLSLYDVITLCFGVNDHSKTLGDWDSTDEDTVMGQFNKCIKYIYKKNPNAVVVVFGPFNGRNVGSFPKYWFGQPWYKIDGKLREACDYYGIPYVSQTNGPVNGYTIQTFIGADGVHPSNLGYKRIGAWFAGQLKNILG